MDYYNKYDYSYRYNHDRKSEEGDSVDSSEKVGRQRVSVSPQPHLGVMASTGSKLAQEIHDEFLVCKICLEGYKSPKSLNCLHTFCEQCIENHVQSECTYKKYSDYREFTCPLCRKRTQLPIGGVKKLPDNFLVSSLYEAIGRQRPSKFPFCDICKQVNRKHKEAKSKCLDCNKLLCKNCVDLHHETKVTSGHSIFDVEIEKDIECKEHKDEIVRFYCEPCEACICVLCTFNEHKDHEISNFNDAVSKYKENIEDLLANCKSKIEKFDEQLITLDACEAVFKDAENKIHDTAIKFIAEIRNREKFLIEEMQNIFGEECMEIINKKNDMQVKIEGLKSTCNLTEVILKGKDIELLLLRKQVSEKLSALSDLQIKQLPPTVTKQVKFYPGELDFGYINDLDRPLVSRLAAKKRVSNSNDEDEDEIMLRANETQTAKPEMKDGQTQYMRQYETSESELSETETETDSEDEGGNRHRRHRPEMSDQTTQTDPTQTEKNTSLPPMIFKKPVNDMVDSSTETENKVTEEKAVNTRSRSLQSLGSLSRRSPPKIISEDGSLPQGYAAAHASRRRRRRERSRTQDMGMSYQGDADDLNVEYTVEPPPVVYGYQAYNEDGVGMPAERAMRGQLQYSSSVDSDHFYSADSNTNSPPGTLVQH